MNESLLPKLDYLVSHKTKVVHHGPDASSMRLELRFRDARCRLAGITVTRPILHLDLDAPLHFIQLCEALLDLLD